MPPQIRVTNKKNEQKIKVSQAGAQPNLRVEESSTQPKINVVDTPQQGVSVAPERAQATGNLSATDARAEFTTGQRPPTAREEFTGQPAPIEQTSAQQNISKRQQVQNLVSQGITDTAEIQRRLPDIGIQSINVFKTPFAPTPAPITPTPLATSTQTGEPPLPIEPVPERDITSTRERYKEQTAPDLLRGVQEAAKTAFTDTAKLQKLGEKSTAVAEIQTSIADKTKEIQDFQTSILEAQKKLEGQGRGISAGLIGGQQQKIVEQNEIKQLRLQSELKNLLAREQAAIGNVDRAREIAQEASDEAFRSVELEIKAQELERDTEEKEDFFSGSNIVSLMKNLPIGESRTITDPNTGRVFTFEGLDDPAQPNIVTSLDDRGTLTGIDKSTGKIVWEQAGVGKAKSATGGGGGFTGGNLSSIFNTSPSPIDFIKMAEQQGNSRASVLAFLDTNTKLNQSSIKAGLDEVFGEEGPLNAQETRIQAREKIREGATLRDILLFLEEQGIEFDKFNDIINDIVLKTINNTQGNVIDALKRQGLNKGEIAGYASEIIDKMIEQDKEEKEIRRALKGIGLDDDEIKEHKSAIDEARGRLDRF